MDDTLYTRQKKEQNRIKKIYKNLPKEQLEIAKKLIERAAYMLVSLEDMEAKINEDGLVVKMPQGAYTIERAHPLLQPYNAMVKNYNATIKQLSELASSRLGKMLDAQKQTGKHRHPYLANFNVQWFYFDFSTLNQMDFDDADQIEFSL